MTDRASAPGRASGAPKMKERMTTHRRPVYAVLDPGTDELTLATFEGEALVRINRSEAVRLAVDILDLFGEAAALSSPSVAESPTATTALGLLRHIQRGHSAVNREHYIECSCGMTFWVPMPKPLSAPSPSAPAKKETP